MGDNNNNNNDNNKNNNEEKKNENVRSFAQDSKKETTFCFRCGSTECKDWNKCPDKNKPKSEWHANVAMRQMKQCCGVTTFMKLHLA